MSVTSDTSVTRRPPEGYGVVPIGNLYQPVKWAAPEHGEGAYHPLASDERGADHTPKTCATAAAAVDWLHAQLAPKQVTLLGSPAPSRQAAQAKRPGKRDKRKPAAGKTAPAPAVQPAPVAESAPKKNRGPLGKTWKWGDGKKRKAAQAAQAR